MVMQTSGADVAAAFRRETAQLDACLQGLREADWDAPTPAEGWSVSDQVAHLAFVFDLAATACHAPSEFRSQMQKVAQGGFSAAVQEGLRDYGEGGPSRVHERYRSAAHFAAQALGATQAETVPWLVNPLPPAVLGMAGMLETFAHGQDVLDALGLPATRTDDLAYLVHFIVRTRDFGYLAHEQAPPAEEFRFEATLPSGREIVVGPADAGQVVRGTAEDLALLASRRRHHADLGVEAVGRDATEWLGLAQAYRGPAGSGRHPGQFDGAERFASTA